MNLRLNIKNSNAPIYKLLRFIYYFIRNFSIPAPKIFWKPVRIIILSIKTILYWIYSVFWINPLYKSIFKKVGKNFKAGLFLPHIIGKGHIYCGNNVRIFGKVDFRFGSIKKEIPEIHIGDNTTIGHNVTFDISGKLVIGDHCMFASGTTIQDCNGHSLDPDERLAGVPPKEKDVYDVTIGSNVWFGKYVYVLPGTKIGDNSIIAATAVVSKRILEKHLVSPAPPKTLKIRRISNYL